MSWVSEEWKCTAMQARTMTFDDGDESDRVLIQTVIDRGVWFPDVGIFILRNGEKVVYVGYTGKPLRERLYLGIMNRERWARAEWNEFTVSMRKSAGYDQDMQTTWKLKQTLNPKFNGRATKG